MKVNKLLVTLLLFVCTYEQTQGAHGPPKGVAPLRNDAQKALVEARKWLDPAELTPTGFSKAKLQFEKLQTKVTEIEGPVAASQVTQLRTDLLQAESSFYRATVEDIITRKNTTITDKHRTILQDAKRAEQMIEQVKKHASQAAHTKLKDFFTDQIYRLVPLEKELDNLSRESLHINNNASKTLEMQLPNPTLIIPGSQWDDIATTIQDKADSLIEKLESMYTRITSIITQIRQIIQPPSGSLIEPVQDHEKNITGEDVRVSDTQFIGTHTIQEDTKLQQAKLPTLGDQLVATMPPSLQRGLVMGFVMMQAAGMSPVGMNIPDVVNNHKFEGTRKPEILPPTIQAIFNFDATLPRLAIINQITHNAPFMKQPIPGVRRLEINALNPYQYIIEQIEAAPQGCPNAISALQAFVSVLLQLYTVQKSASQKWYHLTSANPQNNPILSAIIAEANNLVKIAKQHDPGIAKQLQWEVDSYHTWRRYTHYGSRTVLGGLAGAVGLLGMRYADTDTLHQVGGAAAGVATAYAADKAHQYWTS